MIIARLEELKKQGTVIYCLMNKNGLVAEFDLSLYSCNIAIADDGEPFACLHSTDHDSCYYLRHIFETREQALWYAKICTECTKRFEPPVWEDIKRESKYIFRFVDNNEFIYFEVTKCENTDFDDITIFNSTRNRSIFNKWSNDATKENYVKACEIVRDLLNKGGAK